MSVLKFLLCRLSRANRAKLSYHHDEVVITVEPFMLEKNGVLANGSWLNLKRPKTSLSIADVISSLADVDLFLAGCADR